MYPTIDKEATGKQIRSLMKHCDFSVRDLQEALSLSSVQSIYHWLYGRSLPSVDNLYAMSRLFGVRMDDIVCGSDPKAPDSAALQYRCRIFEYAIRCYGLDWQLRIG